MVVAMELDRNGLEVLSRAECLELLSRARVGRVVVTDRALPAAFPVNFALLGDDVVFLTREGSKLQLAEDEQVVAFEADDADPVLETGWSVLVQGWASLVTDTSEVAAVNALPPRRWAGGGGFRPVRIHTELISGRRLVPAVHRAAAATLDPRIEARFAGCPSCGCPELLPVHVGADRNFICARCAACWHVDGLEVRRVEPESCPGCTFRQNCVAAATRDRLLTAIRARY